MSTKDSLRGACPPCIALLTREQVIISLSHRRALVLLLWPVLTVESVDARKTQCRKSTPAKTRPTDSSFSRSDGKGSRAAAAAFLPSPVHWSSLLSNAVQCPRDSAVHRILSVQLTTRPFHVRVPCRSIVTVSPTDSSGKPLGSRFFQGIVALQLPRPTFAADCRLMERA